MAVEIRLELQGLDGALAVLGGLNGKLPDAMTTAVERVAMAFRDSCVQYAQAGHPDHPDVITGRLSGSMRYDMLTTGVHASAEVGSDAEYAAYVEFGHAQEPGRYVPALGKRLVASFVPAYPWFQPAIIDTFDSGRAQQIFTDTIEDELS